MTIPLLLMRKSTEKEHFHRIKHYQALRKLKKLKQTKVSLKLRWRKLKDKNKSLQKILWPNTKRSLAHNVTNWKN